MSSRFPPQVDEALEVTMKHLNESAYGSIADDWSDSTMDEQNVLSFAQVVRLLKTLMDDPNMNTNVVTNLVHTFIKEYEEGCEEGEEEEGEEEEGEEDEGEEEEEEPAPKKQRPQTMSKTSSSFPPQVDEALKVTMKHLNESAYGSIADDWSDSTMDEQNVLSFGQIARLLKTLMDDPNMNTNVVTNLVQTFIKENEEGCEEGEEDEEEEEPAPKKQRV
jgi:hypothetical protein